jgi:hypothetical protein
MQSDTRLPNGKSQDLHKVHCRVHVPLSEDQAIVSGRFQQSSSALSIFNPVINPGRTAGKCNETEEKPSTGKLTASTRFPEDNDTVPLCHVCGVSRLVHLWGLLRKFSLIKYGGLNKAVELLFNEHRFVIPSSQTRHGPDG